MSESVIILVEQTGLHPACLASHCQMQEQLSLGRQIQLHSCKHEVSTVETLQGRCLKAIWTNVWSDDEADDFGQRGRRLRRRFAKQTYHAILLGTVRV